MMVVEWYTCSVIRKKEGELRVKLTIEWQTKNKDQSICTERLFQSPSMFLIECG